jgi:uncharacterized protein (TIGR02270 family)
MAALEPVIYPVVAQHAAEAAFLSAQRRSAVGAANLSLRQLRYHDQRIAAHVDALRLAKDAGEAAGTMQLAADDSGAIFVAATLAIEGGALEGLERVLALCEAVPGAQSGLFAALGWSDSRDLRGVVAGMLGSSDPFRRLAGLVACCMHRVDPGVTSGRRIEDPDCRARARALRMTGELGLREHVSRLLNWMEDENPACQFWAAWSAVLLGDRNKAHERLLSVGLSDVSEGPRAFRLALVSMNIPAAHGVLQRFPREDVVALGRLIRGSGLVGDPRYVGWLINHMKDDKLARRAGEAFSLITGADLVALNLRRVRSEDLETGPNDDPNDPNVEMDEDDGLPWPDQAKIQAWWNANSQRFQPGVRYFMGQPLNPENCLRVLKEGFQRQRILAAHHLCLLKPGTVLFNTSAPAWRQQRLLAEMS